MSFYRNLNKHFPRFTHPPHFRELNASNERIGRKATRPTLPWR